MKDIMVDLETFDNVKTSKIVSIGAVQCDLTTGEIGSKIYPWIHWNHKNSSMSLIARLSLLPLVISTIFMMNLRKTWVPTYFGTMVI